MELRIRGVSKAYPNGVQALKDVTLTIPAGMYGLLGPNGAGKSTLIRILATLQEPDKGSIRLGGLSAGSGQAIDVLNQKEEVRKTLGYLPQEFGVYPKSTAENLLDHFALLKGMAERRARKEPLRLRAQIPRHARPLLRATDSFAFSRRGPFALYAMREYIGKERVDDALRHLFEKHHAGTPPLPTSKDLYRELQAVTPDSLRYLLHDLFEKNTFWELETDRATAQQTAAGAWQVTMDVRARKVVVDEQGVTTEAPMDDWIEIGVFSEGEPYLWKHLIQSGKQTITVTVPRKPTRAGIDPNHLLPDLEPFGNVEEVEIEN